MIGKMSDSLTKIFCGLNRLRASAICFRIIDLLNASGSDRS